MTGGFSARTRAFLDAKPGSGYNAVRAADATQDIFRRGNEWYQKTGDDSVKRITREQRNEVAALAGKPQQAQDLLSSYMEFVPDKVVEKAIETGDPDDVIPQISTGRTKQDFTPLNPVVESGAEMNLGGPTITREEDTEFMQPGPKYTPESEEMYPKTKETLFEKLKGVRISY